MHVLTHTYTRAHIHTNTHTHEHAYTRTHIHTNMHTHEHTFRDTQRHTRTHPLLRYWAWWSLLLNGRNCDYPKPDNSCSGESFFSSAMLERFYKPKALALRTKSSEANIKTGEWETHNHTIFCLNIIHFSQPVLSITDSKINRMFLHIYIWIPYSLYHMCFCSFRDKFRFFAAAQVPQMTVQMNRCPPYEPLIVYLSPIVELELLSSAQFLS